MKLLKEANIWQNLQQRLQRARDIISTGKSNQEYLTMIKNLENKGYKKGSVDRIIPYLKQTGTNLKTNKIYNLLINSKLIYDTEALEAIAQIVSYSDFDEKDIKKIISSSDPKIIKALYYARNKGMNLDYFMDGNKPKDDAEIIDLINRYLNQKKKENRYDPIYFRSQGYDIDDIESSLNKLDKDTLTNYLYLRALDIGNENFKKLNNIKVKSDDLLPLINNAYMDLNNYWSSKLNKSISISSGELKPKEDILNLTLKKPANYIYNQEKDRIEQLIKQTSVTKDSNLKPNKLELA